MNQPASAYPLTWPQHFKRREKTRRENGQFKTTLAGAIKNVQDSLRKFATDSGTKLDGLVISSNVSLGHERPDDPAVAVWFVWDSLQVCIPVDRYHSVAANLQAIHHIIEARRVELRHGTLALVRATFTGFKALPAPPAGAWRGVLGVGLICSRDEAERAYKTRRSAAHPDKPTGNAVEFDRVEKAWMQAQQELAS